MTRSADFRVLVLAGALFAAVGAAIPARAQAPAPEDLSRGVARISLMDGDVSVRRGDSGEWVAGVINAPLMTDDRIATGQNSRAEVQFDSVNILRIGGNAQIHLALLENGRYHVEIAHGTVTYRMLRESSADIELNTPSVPACSSEGELLLRVGVPIRQTLVEKLLPWPDRQRVINDVGPGLPAAMVALHDESPRGETHFQKEP